jgi:hypothetical protein
MVAIGISEFTFGFAFLYEQTSQNWGDLTAVPVLPSLQQEADDAWDAHLPLTADDFYYQFKLSEYLYRPNAKYIEDQTYNDSYYRIALHKRDNNRQHRRLKLHAQTHPNTFYVAPEMNTIENFNDAFLNQVLTQNSRLIPLQECDDINDAGQHHITYQEGGTGWIQHSEGKRHDKSFRGKDVESLYRGRRGSWRPVDENFSTELFEATSREIRTLVQEEEREAHLPQVALLQFDPHQHTRREILNRTSQLLSVFFGLTLLLVGQRPPG